jgi:hypothetical protein
MSVSIQLVTQALSLFSVSEDKTTKIIDYLLTTQKDIKPTINKSTVISVKLTEKINHWLIRIGDGKNFNNSLQHSLWGFNDSVFSKSFINRARPNDIIWFITANSKGHIIGFATYQSHNKKEEEPIYNTNMSNGWNRYQDYSNEWETVIHYNNYHSIANQNVLSNIKGNAPIRLYKYNLPISLDDIYNMYN